MNNIIAWTNQTVTRSTLVAPTHGFGMGDVRPQAVGNATPMRKRHADAVQATPGSARLPWSPPLT
jgi:hypothetical protein